MKITAKYSHLNGEEFLIVHKNEILDEVFEVISEVDADACRTEVHKAQRIGGRPLYSSRDLSKAFSEGFQRAGWKEQGHHHEITAVESQLGDNYSLSDLEQKETIEVVGDEPTMPDNKTEFVKERIVAEVQFGKYAYGTHYQFAKHLGLYAFDVIDVGIEILPMKALEQEVSSGLPYYERDLLNVVRHGRGVPPVPLVLIGVAP